MKNISSMALTLACVISLASTTGIKADTPTIDQLNEIAKTVRERGTIPPHFLETIKFETETPEQHLKRATIAKAALDRINSISQQDEPTEDDIVRITALFDMIHEQFGCKPGCWKIYDINKPNVLRAIIEQIMPILAQWKINNELKADFFFAYLKTHLIIKTNKKITFFVDQLNNAPKNCWSWQLRIEQNKKIQANELEMLEKDIATHDTAHFFRDEICCLQCLLMPLGLMENLNIRINSLESPSNTSWLTPKVACYSAATLAVTGLIAYNLSDIKETLRDLYFKCLLWYFKRD